MKKRKKQPLATNYQALKTVWYTKLAKSFNDIEKNEDRLKQYSNKFNEPEVTNNWYAKNEYYSMARRFLNDYKFAYPLEKVIWEYHTEGISYRNIAKLLKKVKTRITINKDSINIIINKLEVEMKKLYLLHYIAPNE